MTEFRREVYSPEEVELERFEADKPQLLMPSDIHAGTHYSVRFRTPPMDGLEYVFDYPVLIKGVKRDGEETTVRLMHLGSRHKGLGSESVAYALSDSGFIQHDNTYGRFGGWDREVLDVGYFLPMTETK